MGKQSSLKPPSYYFKRDIPKGLIKGLISGLSLPWLYIRINQGLLPHWLTHQLGVDVSITTFLIATATIGALIGIILGLNNAYYHISKEKNHGYARKNIFGNLLRKGWRILLASLVFGISLGFSLDSIANRLDKTAMLDNIKEFFGTDLNFKLDMAVFSLVLGALLVVGIAVYKYYYTEDIPPPRRHKSKHKKRRRKTEAAEPSADEQQQQTSTAKPPATIVQAPGAGNGSGGSTAQVATTLTSATPGGKTAAPHPPVRTVVLPNYGSAQPAGATPQYLAPSTAPTGRILPPHLNLYHTTQQCHHGGELSPSKQPSYATAYYSSSEPPPSAPPASGYNPRIYAAPQPGATASPTPSAPSAHTAPLDQQDGNPTKTVLTTAAGHVVGTAVVAAGAAVVGAATGGV